MIMPLLTDELADELEGRLGIYVRNYTMKRVKECSVYKCRHKNKYLIYFTVSYDKRLGLPKDKCLEILRTDNPNSIYTNPKLHDKMIQLINSIEEALGLHGFYYTFLGAKEYQVRIECEMNRAQLLHLITLAKIIS